MVAEFAPGGEVSRVIQEGHFRYREGAEFEERAGWADQLCRSRDLLSAG